MVATKCRHPNTFSEEDKTALICNGSERRESLSFNTAKRIRATEH